MSKSKERHKTSGTENEDQHEKLMPMRRKAQGPWAYLELETVIVIV